MIVNFKDASYKSIARPKGMPKARKYELYQAIRDNCIDCSGGMRSEVTYCVMEGCPFFKLRPYQEGV